MQIRLKPRADRNVTPEQIMDQLRPLSDAIPGVRTYYQNPPLVRIGGQQTRSLYQYTLQAQDLNELYRSSQQFEKRLKRNPRPHGREQRPAISSPEVIVDIDRDHASSLGVTADQVGNALYEAFGTAQVSDIYAPTNDYWVIMELLPEFQKDPQSARSGLHSIGQWKAGSAQRGDQARRDRGSLGGEPSGAAPSVTISFNLQPGVSLGDAVERVDTAARETFLPR